MKSRLTDYNLIKKLLIGFMFMFLCIVGINLYNPTDVEAAVLKNKTFYVDSKYPIKVEPYHHEDGSGGSLDTCTPGWPSDLGDISVDVSRLPNGTYRYTIIMTNVNVSHHTPYLAVSGKTASGWKVHKPRNDSQSYYPQYKDNGCNRKANKVDDIGDAGNTVNYGEIDGTLFIYTGYEFTDNHIIIDWTPFTYTYTYNINKDGAHDYYGGYGFVTPSDIYTTYGVKNYQIPYSDATIGITGTYDYMNGGDSYIPTKSGYDFAGWVCFVNGKINKTAKHPEGIWQNGDTFNPRTDIATKITGTNDWDGTSNYKYSIRFIAKWQEQPYHIIYYTNEFTKDDGKWHIGNAPDNWNPSKEVSVATSSSYKYGSGKIMDKTGYYPSGTANLITNPYQLFGWHFTGWNTQSNGGGIKYNAGQKGLKAGTSKGLLPITTDTYGNKVVKLYAMWSPNIYRAILNDNGGSGGTGTIYEKYDVCFTSDSNGNHKLDSVDIPVREHMDFDGYYTSKDGGTKVINSNGTFVMKPNTFTGYDSVYYAHWKPSVYQITLHKNGGGDNETIYEKYTVNIYNEKSCKNVKSKVGVPSRTNYTFAGYYTEDNFYKKAKSIGELSGAQVIDKNGNYIGSTKTLVNKDTHLYAAWIPNVYTITLDNQIPSLAEEIQKGSTKVYERYSICYYMNTNVMYGSEESHQVTGWSNNRGWAYFTAPATGTYTFYGSDGSYLKPYTLQEGETIMLYTRINNP